MVSRFCFCTYIHIYVCIDLYINNIIYIHQKCALFSLQNRNPSTLNPLKLIGLNLPPKRRTPNTQMNGLRCCFLFKRNIFNIFSSSSRSFFRGGWIPGHFPGNPESSAAGNQRLWPVLAEWSRAHDGNGVIIQRYHQLCVETAHLGM